MSGIFGIYNFHNPSVSPKRLQLFSDAMAHRGPDGCNTLKDKFIGLGHCMLHTTTESLTEHLPYYDPESGLAITADARIDNRDEIAAAIGISTSHRKEIADSQLILAAYKKWETSCFIKLLGDFSFVLWDSRNQRLICVRDAIGIKPFYYRKTSEGFFFSSEIKPLALLEESLPKVNEGMVAEYLAFQFATRNETLFQDIFRLPPAHYLVLERDKISIQRYWDLSFKDQLHYKRNEEYGEHFYDLFKSSVSSRIRSHQPVSAELSGGIDSSSIVSMASLLCQGDILQQVLPYALVFPGLPCDESNYISSVVDKWNVSTTLVPANNFHPPHWKNQIKRSFHVPDMPNLSICDELVKKVQTSGSRVILSGIGGDEWFAGCGVNFADLFAHRHFQDLFKELRFHNLYDHKTFLKKLFRLFLWPVIPKLLKKIVIKKNLPNSFPDWLPSSFIAKTNLLERISKKDARLYDNSLVKAFYNKYLISDHQGFYLETLDRHRALIGVENRYPFLDKQLIEYSASLPEYQKSFHGETKRTIRQGLKLLLPDKVLNRHNKAEFSYFFGQSFLLPIFERNICELKISDNGWINKDIFLKTYYQSHKIFSKNPTKQYNKIWPVWFAFAVEMWYKCMYNQTK